MVFRNRADKSVLSGPDQSPHNFQSGAKPGARVSARDRLTTVLRLTAWLLFLATVVLSVAPPWYRPLPEMPLIDIPRPVEHFAIFLAAGLVFGLGYRASYLAQVVLITLFAAAVEIAQLLAPGRHARWSDFLIDASAAIIGVVAARALIRLSGRESSRSKQER
jgi:VanZ family protein